VRDGQHIPKPALSDAATDVAGTVRRPCYPSSRNSPAGPRHPGVPEGRIRRLLYVPQIRRYASRKPDGSQAVAPPLLAVVAMWTGAT
jgi:hypothetical protein